MVVAVIVMVGVMADTWMTVMPLAETPRAFAALNCAEGAKGPIVELPLGDPYPDVAAMYRQMSHHRPLVNGYSGYFPPHYSALRFGLTLRDPDVLTQLAAHGITDIVVNRGEDPEGHWDKYVEVASRCPAPLHGGQAVAVSGRRAASSRTICLPPRRCQSR